jgi:2-polyprenyl-3-methyl-5-hydroxy-6-metoxy-1,4-benzoquinol methylase
MFKNYYDKNAERFISDTINVDMGAHYERFLSYLSAGASILDAGCGSGRDSLAFKKLGYIVQAFDASETMVVATRLLADIPTSKMTFQSAAFDTSFDGIWACASLLHVPRSELSGVIKNLTSYLKINGTIYASFKYGEDEREKGGRYFNDMTEASLSKYIDAISDLNVVEQWISNDQRAGRANERWLNCLVQKVSTD